MTNPVPYQYKLRFRFNAEESVLAKWSDVKGSICSSPEDVEAVRERLLAVADRLGYDIETSIVSWATDGY